MVRHGTKQLEMYENPALRDCMLNGEMAAWANRPENQTRVAALRRRNPLLGVGVDADHVLGEAASSSSSGL